MAFEERIGKMDLISRSNLAPAQTPVHDEVTSFSDCRSSHFGDTHKKMSFKFLALLALLSGSGIAGHHEEKHDSQPNILYIMSDDHAAHGISAYGCNYDGGYQTPAGWELYDLVKDPHETINLYNDPANAELVADLKKQLVATRKRVGDDGSHFPAAEKVLQEFWDYDAKDREKSEMISHEFLKRRQAEIKAGKRNIPTHKGFKEASFPE